MSGVVLLDDKEAHQVVVLQRCDDAVVRLDQNADHVLVLDKLSALV